MEWSLLGNVGGVLTKPLVACIYMKRNQSDDKLTWNTPKVIPMEGVLVNQFGWKDNAFALSIL